MMRVSELMSTLWSPACLASSTATTQQLEGEDMHSTGPTLFIRAGLPASVLITPLSSSYWLYIMGLYLPLAPYPGPKHPAEHMSTFRDLSVLAASAIIKRAFSLSLALSPLCQTVCREFNLAVLCCMSFPLCFNFPVLCICRERHWKSMNTSMENR